MLYGQQQEVSLCLHVCRHGALAYNHQSYPQLHEQLLTCEVGGNKQPQKQAQYHPKLLGQGLPTLVVFFIRSLQCTALS
jgi:hypothetical protein